MAGYSLLHIIAESLVVTYIYHILGFRILRRFLDRFCETKEWYTNLTWEGRIGNDVREEFKYGVILSVHHIFGGFLMLLGFILNSPSLFAQGVILEIADDIHDTVILLFSGWPFNSSPESARELSKLMIPHHVFGLVLGPILLVKDMQDNAHVQAVGAALLMAGGVQLSILSFQRTLSRLEPLQAWQDFFVRIINNAVFFYCRFWVFPFRSYIVCFGTDAGLWYTTNVVTKTVMLIALFGMIFFNVLAGIIIMRGMNRAYQNAVTLDDTMTISKAAKRTLKDIEKIFMSLVDMNWDDVLEVASRSSKSYKLFNEEPLYSFKDLVFDTTEDAKLVAKTAKDIYFDAEESAYEFEQYWKRKMKELSDSNFAGNEVLGVVE